MIKECIDAIEDVVTDTDMEESEERDLFSAQNRLRDFLGEEYDGDDEDDDEDTDEDDD